MRKILGAVALSLLVAAPVLAQAAAPQGSTTAPDSQVPSTRRSHDQTAMSRRMHGNLDARHRVTRGAAMRESRCPADSTNEAGQPTTPGGYCLPGGRS